MEDPGPLRAQHAQIASGVQKKKQVLITCSIGRACYWWFKKSRYHVMRMSWTSSIWTAFPSDSICGDHARFDITISQSKASPSLQSLLPYYSTVSGPAARPKLLRFHPQTHVIHNTRVFLHSHNPWKSFSLNAHSQILAKRNWAIYCPLFLPSLCRGGWVYSPHLGNSWSWLGKSSVSPHFLRCLLLLSVHRDWIYW